MLSFFGEQCLKDAVIARIREHQRLDQIVQGTYWDGAKGCAIGCVLHSGEHKAFETQLGLPVFLAYMDEHIFESLPLVESRTWPLRFMEAVPVGVDLELIFPRFIHWLLSDPHGVRQYADARTLPIIDSLVSMYARRIEGLPFDPPARAAEAWATEARARATEATEEAARATEAAARATEAWARAAARATEAAARATEARARAVEAAWATEAARAAAGSRPAHIHRQADALIAILQSYESRPSATPCSESMTQRILALH